jgi:hypothetical protein
MEQADHPWGHSIKGTTSALLVVLGPPGLTALVVAPVAEVAVSRTVHSLASRQAPVVAAAVVVAAANQEALVLEARGAAPRSAFMCSNLPRQLRS